MEEDDGRAIPNRLKRSHVEEADDPAVERARSGPRGRGLFPIFALGYKQKTAENNGPGKPRKPPVSRKFHTHKENVHPLESFWGTTGDKMLIIGDKDERRRQCRLYTKADHQAEFGLRTKDGYGKLPTLYKSSFDENAYVGRRRLYEEDGEGFNRRMDSYGLPRAGPYAPVEEHGIGRFPHLLVVNHAQEEAGKTQLTGKWYASDDVVERKDEFTGWAEQYGKDKLYKRLPDGSYRKLDFLSRSENWSAAADFMVMEGWPRVAVRTGGDRYTDIRAHYSAAGLQEVFILSKSGNAYLSPDQLKRIEPDYIKMMREMGLPPGLADTCQKAGPEKLFCNGQYELLGGAAYEEAAKRVSDECKLVQIQSLSGRAKSSYMLLPEFLDCGQSMIDRYAGSANKRSAAASLEPDATTEARAQAIMAELRGLLPRSRGREGR